MVDDTQKQLKLTEDKVKQADNVQANLSLSPAYDLLQSLTLLAQDQRKGRWKAWAEQTEQQLASSEEQLWQAIRHWFRGPFPLGNVGLPLIPLLPLSATIEEFFSALEQLSLADFLRIIVTMSPTDPETPLDAESLLALVNKRVLAKVFIDDHFRFTGKGRMHVLQVLADPEAARHELLALLRRYHELIFSTLEQQLGEERSLAAERLLDEMQLAPFSLPYWSSRTFELAGFSSLVVAPSVIQDIGTRGYVHEIKCSLLDDMTYEPMIVMVGTREALGSAPPKRRAIASPVNATDRAEHWAAVYSVLADPARLRLLHLLAERPYYQQELALALHMSGATVSHHITALLRVGFVRMERQAHRTYLVLQVEAFHTFLRESQQYIVGSQQETEGQR